jgi:hypothetical protein
MEFAKKKEKKKKIVAGYGSLKRNNDFESFFSKKLVPHLIHKIAD